MTDTARPASYARAFRRLLVAFLTVTCVFIVWTATVVIRQIYADAVPSRDERIPPLAAPCEEGLTRLGRALDRGLVATLWADDEEDAARTFERALAPDWDEASRVAVERACGENRMAKEAFAAMVRQRRVQEGWARRHARETLASAGGARRFLPSHVSR